MSVCHKIKPNPTSLSGTHDKKRITSFIYIVRTEDKEYNKVCEYNKPKIESEKISVFKTLPRCKLLWEQWVWSRKGEINSQIPGNSSLYERQEIELCGPAPLLRLVLSMWLKISSPKEAAKRKYIEYVWKSNKTKLVLRPSQKNEESCSTWFHVHQLFIDTRGTVHKGLERELKELEYESKVYKEDRY